MEKYPQRTSSAYNLPPRCWLCCVFSVSGRMFRMFSVESSKFLVECSLLSVQNVQNVQNV